MIRGFSMDKLFAFISYVIIVSFTPGPNNLLSMSFAATLGFRKALKYMSGVFVGFSTIFLCASYFNIFLEETLPAVSPFLKAIGSVYVLFLAYKIITTRMDAENPSLGKLCSFYAGVAMQFLNVKGILYALTVTSSFIIPYSKSFPLILVSAISLALVAVSANVVWALGGSAFQKLLSKYQGLFKASMCILLIYVALAMIGII